MKLFMLLSALLTTLYLTGCNTLQGFGKDIQRGGEAIEKTAK
ncbi:MAG: entericidin A/B family lipoprotein [Nitrosomonas sp.]|nr:entericidin A/B family lipoprotein [Nitrosomonas sp.]MBK7363673.1 entericidin A/B family lipoprotein [Nitrosomonas sp.]